MPKVGCLSCGKTKDSTEPFCPHCGAAVQPTFHVDPTTGMSETQRTYFDAEMVGRRKDSTVGVLLALFLGGLGVHHFYLRNWLAGFIYLAFCWTFIPAIIAFVEAFLMPDRIRRFNAQEAQLLAARIKVMTAAPGLQTPA